MFHVTDHPHTKTILLVVGHFLRLYDRLLPILATRGVKVVPVVIRLAQLESDLKHVETILWPDAVVSAGLPLNEEGQDSERRALGKRPLLVGKTRPADRAAKAPESVNVESDGEVEIVEDEGTVEEEEEDAEVTESVKEPDDEVECADIQFIDGEPRSTWYASFGEGKSDADTSDKDDNTEEEIATKPKSAASNMKQTKVCRLGKHDQKSAFNTIHEADHAKPISNQDILEIERTSPTASPTLEPPPGQKGHSMSPTMSPRLHPSKPLFSQLSNQPVPLRTPQSPQSPMRAKSLFSTATILAGKASPSPQRVHKSTVPTTLNSEKKNNEEPEKCQNPAQHSPPRQVRSRRRHIYLSDVEESDSAIEINGTPPLRRPITQDPQQFVPEELEPEPSPSASPMSLQPPRLDAPPNPQTTRSSKSAKPPSSIPPARASSTQVPSTFKRQYVEVELASPSYQPPQDDELEHAPDTPSTDNLHNKRRKKGSASDHAPAELEGADQDPSRSTSCSAEDEGMNPEGSARQDGSAERKAGNETPTSRTVGRVFEIDSHSDLRTSLRPPPETQLTSKALNGPAQSNRPQPRPRPRPRPRSKVANATPIVLTDEEDVVEILSDTEEKFGPAPVPSTVRNPSLAIKKAKWTIQVSSSDVEPS